MPSVLVIIIILYYAVRQQIEHTDNQHNRAVRFFLISNGSDRCQYSICQLTEEFVPGFAGW